jgi:hypothetical protein
MVQRDEYIEKVFFAKKVFSKNDAAQHSPAARDASRRALGMLVGRV